MIYYFAYGSNLHHMQMKKRCPNCQFIKKIILHNYNLAFRSKYGAADIEKKKSMEHYILYLSLTKRDWMFMKNIPHFIKRCFLNIRVKKL